MIEGGKVVSIISISTDITERKSAEKEIRNKIQEITEERDKINKIVHGIGDAVFVVDKDQKIILFNKVAEELSGFSAEEALGKKYNKILQFKHEKTGELKDQFITNTLESGKIQKMENHTVLIDKEGSSTPIVDSSAPVKDDKGNITACVVVFRDATKERAIDRAKTEFVSIASHQLRTPLSGVKWFTELLLNGKAGDLIKKQKDYIAQIAVSNERMIALVDDLLNVTHIETGKKFILQKRSCNISKIIERVILENSTEFKSRKITVGYDKNHCTKRKISIDKEKIEQALDNIISNAIKYSKDGGKISISCKLKNGNFYLKFKIMDGEFQGVSKKRFLKRFFELIM